MKAPNAEKATVAALAKLYGPSACQWCGSAIKQGTRGRFKSFCSARCQAAAWRAENPGRRYEQARRRYATMSEQEKAEGRARAAARSRALARLQARYPNLYRRFYEEELERRADGSDAA